MDTSVKAGLHEIERETRYQDLCRRFSRIDEFLKLDPKADDHGLSAELDGLLWALSEDLSQ